MYIYIYIYIRHTVLKSAPFFCARMAAVQCRSAPCCLTSVRDFVPAVGLELRNTTTNYGLRILLYNVLVLDADRANMISNETKNFHIREYAS